MEAAHGELASAPRHFPALVDLLTTGATTRLSKQAPIREHGRGDVLDVRRRQMTMVPDEEELVAAALGHEVRAETPKRQRQGARGARQPVACRSSGPGRPPSRRCLVSAEAGPTGCRRPPVELHRLDVYPARSARGVGCQRREAGAHPGPSSAWAWWASAWPSS
jgi:hypothetical protein